MARPRDLVVRWVSDVKGFLKGTDEIERALADQERDLRDVDRAGTRSADSLADAYHRAGQRIRADAKATGKVTRGEFADAGKEAGNEFAQNLGESISSGDVSGMLSGTVGGLVGTFGAAGPIGLALGALAGVGVGAFQAIQQGAEKAQAAAQLAFDQLHESTSREARLNAVLTDRFGSTLAGWEQIQRYADGSGESAEAIANALIDGGPAARHMADRFDDVMRAAYETTGEVDKAQSILIDGADDLRDRADAMERAAKAARTERDALRESEGILRRSAAYYAARGSAYAPGGSVYASQVPKGRVP